MNALFKPSSRYQRRLSDWLLPNALADRDIFDLPSSAFPSKLGVNVPSVNIRETPTGYVLDVAAPGLKRTDFKIEVENNALTISAEKEEEKEEKEEKEKENGYTRQEYFYGSFSRCFALPENVNEGAIEAKYDNGILTVSVPKAVESSTKQAKSIPVK